MVCVTFFRFPMNFRLFLLSCSFRSVFSNYTGSEDRIIYLTFSILLTLLYPSSLCHSSLFSALSFEICYTQFIEIRPDKLNFNFGDYEKIHSNLTSVNWKHLFFLDPKSNNLVDCLYNILIPNISSHIPT